MAKRVSTFFLAVFLALGLTPVPALADEAADTVGQTLQLESGTYVEHEAIAYVAGDVAQMQPYSRGSDILSGAEPLMDIDAESAAEAFGEEAVEAVSAPAARMRSTDGADEAASPAGQLVLVRDESLSVEELIASLEADSRVVFAEPNYLVEAYDEQEASAQTETSERSEADLSAQSAVLAEQLDADPSEADAESSQGEAAQGETRDGAAPTDRQPVVFGSDTDAPASDMTALQWGMSNDGSMAGVSPDDAVDIGFSTWEQAAASGNWADAAQTARSGMETVVVAVIDCGIDETNPDLSGVLWDDGEAYPQLTALGGDVHGFSTLSDGTSTSPISREQHHGTHVAGIIAAAWDGQGVSGVAPNVELMSVRDEIDTVSSLLECINYVTVAAKAGVNVRAVNCSWGVGSHASRAFDVAFTQLGREGAIAVFASGNAASNMDATLNTVSTLRDNPYVVTVDSIDASGALSPFSCYGQATTDVVAPGSAILSTFPSSAQNYLGEFDGNAALYESFDEQTHAADESGIVSGAQALQFKYVGFEVPASAVSGGKRFDGMAALALSYDVQAAQNLGLGGLMAATSSAVDLSALSEKPRYLSIRYVSEGEGGAACAPLVMVGVKTVDGRDSGPLQPVSQFGFGGDGWAGQYVELPDNTDFSDFHVVLYFQNLQVSALGGQQEGVPANGVIYVDGIGLGSDLVPYDYEQGTSMAAPAVTGAAAVMAGLHPGDSAAQLAARVKGAAQGAAYSELCSTGGYATVDGGQAPGPVPVSARVSDDGRTIVVRGYFIARDAAVSVSGKECAILSRAAVGDEGDTQLVELSVQTPAGFPGGEAWVEITAGGARGRMLVEFGRIAQSGQEQGAGEVFYDQANLPVPEELDDWGGWQLVGFAGSVYALPRENAFSTERSHTFMMKYEPAVKAWSRVDLPSADALAEAGMETAASVSGATYQGSLVCQITSRVHDAGGGFSHKATYWRYTAQGQWELLAVALPGDGDLALSALGSNGESLYAFGGFGTFGQADGEEGDCTAILRLDIQQGAAEQVGELLRARQNAQVACCDGVFLVGGGQNDAAQEGTSMGVERVGASDGSSASEAEEGTVTVAALTSCLVPFSTLVAETGQLAYAPAAVAGGFMVAGPRSDAGTADTYTVGLELGVAPQEYGKIACAQRMLAPSALAYDGWMYVLAATESQPYRVFSATAVETAAQPGDYVASDPTPNPIPDPGPDPTLGQAPDPTPDTASQPGGDGALKDLASAGDAAAPMVLGVLVTSALAIATAVSARRADLRRK